MRIFKKIIKIGMLLLIIAIFSAILINAHVKKVGKSRLVTIEEAAQKEEIDCVLVLGCLVRPDGNPFRRCVYGPCVILEKCLQV